MGTPRKSVNYSDASKGDRVRFHFGDPVAAGLLILLCLGAYANAFRNTFTMDDYPAIVNNVHIRSFQLGRIFTSGYWGGVIRDGQPCEREPCMEASVAPPRKSLYRPLVVTTYALNFAFGDLNPHGYHLVNILLHALVTLAFYGVSRQIGCSRAGAFLGAAVFAVHPLHTEAVAGIVGRAELMMALGVLLALRWYIQSGAPRRFELGSGAASWAAFLVAILSKEQAFVLPALLLIYDLFAVKGGSWAGLVRGAVRRYSGYLVILAAVLGLRAVLLPTVIVADQQIAFLDNPMIREDALGRLLTAIKVSGKYFWLFIWPDRLSADYSYNAISVVRSLWETGLFWALLAWAVLFGAAAWSYFRGARVIFFAFGLMFATFLPASNFILPIGTIMGERLFYLPSAGLCLMIAAVWDRMWLQEKTAALGGAIKWTGLAAAAAILVLLTARTSVRNRDWMNDRTLMESAIQVVPQSAKVNYGMALIKLRKGEKGLEHFERAFEIYPDYPRVNGIVARNYGRALLAEERIDEAIELLEQAVRSNPRTTSDYHYLGLAYTRKGLWKEAEAAFRNMLAFNPAHVETHNNLGFVLWKQARHAEALAAAEAAIDLKRDFAEAHYNKAVILESMGRYREAIASYEETLRLKPIASARDRLHKLLKTAS